MLDKVEAKIAELKKQQRDEYYRKKEADLAKWGLATQKKGKNSTPVVVTDEEYEALIDASSGVGMPTRNGFAKVLNVSALVVVAAGIIIGFSVANFHEEMSFPIFMGAVAASVLVALILLGLGEALRLLQEIADAQRIEYGRRRPQVVKEFPDEQPDATPGFSVETVDDVPMHPYNTPAAQPGPEDEPQPEASADPAEIPPADAPETAE